MPDLWTEPVGVDTLTDTPPRNGRRLFTTLMGDRSARLGLWTVVLVILAALTAPLVAVLVGHGATEQFRETALDASGIPVGPSSTFWLGADGEGRDVLVRTLYGTRISLLVGIPATTLAMVIGTIVGVASGLTGGIFDRVTGQMIDMVLSFPFIVTALSLLALNRGPDGQPVVSPLVVVIVIIAAFTWTYFARLSRGLTVTLRSRPFVDAAVTLGAKRRWILFREVLPNVLPVVVVYWAVQLPASIVAEATLSFLGVGIQAPTPSLGNMIADAQRTSLYQVQPWYLLGPAIALFVIVLGFNAFSSGLRNVLDPKGR